jgi:nucleoside-diphosphate-sugar epimerase
MLALVTGGSGYFGTTLVRALLETGRDVRVLDLVDTDDRPPEVGLVLGDICDPSAVARSVEGVAEVYHNVAQVPLARDEKAFQRVNIEGTGVLLAASRDAGVRKVVHTSSSAVFGIPASNPVTRDTPPHPVESYGRAKLEAEQLCHRAAAEGLDVSIVRPRTIVGHGRLGIFGILFDWIADGAAVPVLGNGDNRYQFVHADDVARACLLAAERPGPATFHIGAEEFGTMRETLVALCEYAGTGARVRSLPARPTSIAMAASARLRLTPFGPYHWNMYGQSMWFDLSDAQRELGWHARWTTNAMFRQAYDWFLEHRQDPAGVSEHRRSAKQGALRLAKRLLR